MSNLFGKSRIKEVEISAVIIRADGSVEDLGVISSSKWSRLKFWKKDQREANDRIHAANKAAQSRM